MTLYLGNNQGIDTTNRDAVAAYLDKLEVDILNPVGSMGICWMGMSVKFVYTAKKNGGKCKRGKVWGCIKYFDESRNVDGCSWIHPEISKEKAIEEIMKPPELKRALSYLLNMYTCWLCRGTAIGKAAQVKWGRLSYPKSFMRYGMGELYVHAEGHKDICPECLKKILKKELDL